MKRVVQILPVSVALGFLLFVKFANAFVLPSITRINPNVCRVQPCLLYNIPNDFGTLLTSVEIFDGSQIIDPIVVSNVFWGSFTTKLVSFVVGQIFAVIVFSIISSLAAKQISALGTYLAESFVNKIGGGSNNQVSTTQIDKPLSNINKSYYVQPDFGKLFICLGVDIIGSSSGLLPILGEVTDLAWAPIAGLILKSLYGSNIIFAFEFIEEILPFTDILPLATVCWVIDTFFWDSDLARVLQLGRYKPLQYFKDQSSVIDIDVKNSEDKFSKKF